MHDLHLTFRSPARPTFSVIPPLLLAAIVVGACWLPVWTNPTIDLNRAPRAE